MYLSAQSGSIINIVVSKKINCLFQRLLQNPIEHLNTSLLLQHIMQKKNKPRFTCFILYEYYFFELKNCMDYCKVSAIIDKA